MNLAIASFTMSLVSDLSTAEHAHAADDVKTAIPALVTLLGLALGTWGPRALEENGAPDAAALLREIPSLDATLSTASIDAARAMLSRAFETTHPGHKDPVRGLSQPGNVLLVLDQALHQLRDFETMSPRYALYSIIEAAKWAAKCAMSVGPAGREQARLVVEALARA